jgi:hypothetical protein
MVWLKPEGRWWSMATITQHADDLAGTRDAHPAGDDDVTRPRRPDSDGAGRSARPDRRGPGGVLRSALLTRRGSDGGARRGTAGTARASRRGSDGGIRPGLPGAGGTGRMDGPGSGGGTRPGLAGAGGTSRGGGRGSDGEIRLGLLGAGGVAHADGKWDGSDRAGRPRPRPGRAVPAWTALLFGIGGTGLVAWTGYIATSLPAHSVSAHYNVAWTGFDTLLAVLVLGTAWLAYRRSPRVASASAATAALLLADAWFDITTAAPGRPLQAAVLLAAFVELPAAALAFHVHRKASATNRARNREGNSR